MRPFRLFPLTLFLFSLLPSLTYAVSVNFPFQNVSLASKGTLQSSYSFTDSNGTHPIIFCYQNNSGSSVNLTWPYKGKRQTGAMPLQLKTNAIFQGSFADANGVLVVTNNSGAEQFVSCQYAF